MYVGQPKRAAVVKRLPSTRRAIQINKLQRDMFMNKLLAVLIAGLFAADAFAQQAATTAPAPAPSTAVPAPSAMPAAAPAPAAAPVKKQATTKKRKTRRAAKSQAATAK